MTREVAVDLHAGREALSEGAWQRARTRFERAYALYREHD
jgi:hypothetical protein